MRIDSRYFTTPCSCGKTHHLQTQLCVIESGALSRLDQAMAELHLSGRRCVVYDENTYCVISPALRPQAAQEILLPGSGLHADEYSTADFLEKLDPQTEILIAVGGGPLHDIVRFSAKKRGIPFVSVPTAASCDGFSADVAAMTWGGIKKTMSCQAPVLVVADTDILRAAPKHLLLSGIGDVLGKYIALAEWRMAHALTGEAFCQTIHDCMKDAVDRIWQNCAAAAEGDGDALESVTAGLMLSGIAMQLFGNSRPASGAEHHISHLIEIEPAGLPAKNLASHGEKVGVGTILASREYHRLAQIEDISPLLMPYEPIDQEKLRSFVGEFLYPSVRDENENDALAAVTPEAVSAAWPAMREIIASIPEPDAIEVRLAAIGAKHSLADIGLDPALEPLLLDACPIARNRLTLMRLRRMIRYESVFKKTEI